jgi:hypothetical protein
MARVTQEQFNEVQAQVEGLTKTLSDLNEAYEARGFEAAELKEALGELQVLMGTEGLFTAQQYNSTGPSLAEISQRAHQVRNMTALSPWMKRGRLLRTNYVLSGNTSFANLPPRNETGTKTKFYRAFDKAINQRNLFSNEARELREYSYFDTGAAIYLFDKEKVGRLVPLDEFSSFITNPDFPQELWGLRRTWTTINKSGESETKNVWYFFDTYKDLAKENIGKGRSQIQVNGRKEDVDWDATLIGDFVNSAPGWVFGFPDGGIAPEYITLYSQIIKAGHAMQLSLAAYAFKFKSASAAGAKNAATSVSEATGSGKTATYSDGDLTALSTAGKGYAFSSAIAVLAIVATSFEVSVVDLSASPGDAGSSYSAAQALDLPTRLAMEGRRRHHVELERRILRFFGENDAEVVFSPLETTTDQYNKVRTLVLEYTQGVMTAEQFFTEAEQAQGRYASKYEQTDTLVGNTKSAEMWRDKLADTDNSGQSSSGSGDSGTDTDTGNGAQVSVGAGRGQSTGTGDTGRDNAQRNDIVANK